MVGEHAITQWPQRGEQRQMVQKALHTTLLAELCVLPATFTLAASEVVWDEASGRTCVP